MSKTTTGAILAVAISLPALAPATVDAAGCAFGGSSEASLQDVFTNMFGAVNAPNTSTGCIPASQDALWRTVDSVGSATILVEIAGNANGNTFGLYDAASPGNSLQIFSGASSTSSSAFITVSGAPGAYHVSIFSTDAPPVQAVFSSNAFGFYLQQPNGGQRFYSESFRNAPINGDGANGSDYMYSYQGNGALFQAGSLYAPDSVEGQSFDANDAIIAWEDLSTGSDRDYQDMVVLLRDITPAATPVPLPAAVWFLGAGLFGLAGFRRKRAM